MSKFRVKLWDIASSDRSRNSLKATIFDAKDVGASHYANEGGEVFFTLPWNHPQVNEIQPWLRHYEIARRNSKTGAYDVVSVGLLDELDASANEVIAYGSDYLSLFDMSISGSNTSYTNTAISTIIQDQLSLAIFQPAYSAKSVTRCVALGTIQTTSDTTTVLSSFQPRLEFVRQLADILQADGTTRPILSVTRSTPITVSFETNKGSDVTSFWLEYGGYVNDFRYVPGFAQMTTDAYAIGQKREGAAILYSHQTNSLISTYGIIQAGTVFIDIIDQTALDKKTKRFSKDLSVIGKNVALAVRGTELGPYDGWDIADSVRVKINRGLVNIDDLYTIWGFEWTGRPNGSEELFLSLQPKRT